MAMWRCLHDLYISPQVHVEALRTQWSFWGLLSLPRYLQTVLAFSCSMLWMWPSSFWSSSWDRSASSSRNRLVTEPFGDTVESWRKREELTVKDVVQCHSITQLACLRKRFQICVRARPIKDFEGRYKYLLVLKSYISIWRVQMQKPLNAIWNFLL